MVRTESDAMQEDGLDARADHGENREHYDTSPGRMERKGDHVSHDKGRDRHESPEGSAYF